MNPLRYLFTTLIVSLFLSGCASVSVTDVQRPAKPRSLPPLIYVEQFQTKDGIFRLDREGTEFAAVQNGLRVTLQNELVQRLHAHVAPARPFFSGTYPRTGWLVRGRFLKADQGSRALRLLIGLGAGGTKIETRVEVVDLSTSRVFLTFKTTGGSNAEPGALSGIIATGPIDLAVGVVAGAAGQLSRGLTEDLGRTAYEATALISEFSAEQGWIDPKKSLHAKKLFDERPDVIRNHTR